MKGNVGVCSLRLDEPIGVERPNRMLVKKIDKDQQVRKGVFLECLMYEAMTEEVAMTVDKSLCLWTSPFSSA